MEDQRNARDYAGFCDVSLSWAAMFSYDLSGASGDFEQSRPDRGVTVGLGEEANTIRHLRRKRPAMAGRDHDDDGRPAVANREGKLDAVHRARHIDIGEDDPDVGVRLKDMDGLVGVRRLDRDEAGLLDNVDGIHANERFVFHDEDRDP
ncbi:hypothetical protein J2Y55_003046 [Bosea sp. BE125]|nr:hypothetical protein [Bosea sp. BE125]